MKFDTIFKSIQKPRTEEEINDLLFKVPKIYWYSKSLHSMNVSLRHLEIANVFEEEFFHILNRMDVLYKNKRAKLNLYYYSMDYIRRVRKYIFDNKPNWLYVMMDDDGGLIYDIR